MLRGLSDYFNWICNLLRPTSIQQQLFITMATLLFVSVLGIYLVNLSVTVNSELEKQREELNLLASTTSQNLEAALIFDDVDGTKEVLENLRANHSIISAAVLGAHDQHIASYSKSDTKADDGYLLKLLKFKKIMEVRVPIVNSNITVGHLIIKKSLAKTWQILLDQILQFALIALLIFFISVLFIKRISSSFVSPISGIAKTAREISQHGIYSTRVPVESNNEIGEMSQALNLMLAEIETREQDLCISAVAFESQEGMFVTNANNIILRTNLAFTHITGYSAQEALGNTPRILQSGLQNADFYGSMWSQILNTGSWRGEIVNKRKDGTTFPALISISAVKNMMNETTHYVATINDITEQKLAEDKIVQLAFYDYLTGLPNRRLFMDRLAHRLSAANRSKHYGALMFMDLDNFKTLNDTLGHDVGDMLLVQVAERISKNMRENDTVARLGGDEFVILLDELSISQYEAIFQAELVGKKIHMALSEPYQLGIHSYQCTPSIGIVLLSEEKTSIDELMKCADIAMYQAKKSGRNALRFFDPEMQAAIESRSQMERELTQALDLNQFTLYFQPQVSSTGKIVGAEALLRWVHPTFGVISPIDFIDVAEETGLIIPIGAWVINAACRQIKDWESSDSLRNIQVSVNVSARQFFQHDFVAFVIETISKIGIQAKNLKFELTESSVIENIGEVTQKMETLKLHGIQFSMDDFGTGHSSLVNLKQLPISQIKIDQAFVKDVEHDNDDAVIVKTIIALANHLELDVVAEGVENSFQRDFLIAGGCHHFQGYLFGSPMNEKAFELQIKQCSITV